MLWFRLKKVKKEGKEDLRDYQSDSKDISFDHNTDDQAEDEEFEEENAYDL